MIIKIPCDKCAEDTSVSMETETGMEAQFIVLTTDETNIERAVEIMLKNYWVVGIEYRGSVTALKGVDTKHCYVYSTYSMPEISYDSVKAVMQVIPDNLTMVFKVTSTFCDMRLVFDMCKEYGDRIRFDGGHFLNLPDCHFGEVGREHVAMLKTKTKMDVVLKGVCSTQPICDYIETEHSLGTISFHSVYRSRKTGAIVELREEPKGKKPKGRPKKKDTDLQETPAVRKLNEHLKKVEVIKESNTPKKDKKTSVKKQQNFGTSGGLGTF